MGHNYRLSTPEQRAACKARRNARKTLRRRENRLIAALKTFRPTIECAMSLQAGLLPSSLALHLQAGNLRKTKKAIEILHAEANAFSISSPQEPCRTVIFATPYPQEIPLAERTVVKTATGWRLRRASGEPKGGRKCSM